MSTCTYSTANSATTACEPDYFSNNVDAPTFSTSSSSPSTTCPPPTVRSADIYDAHGRDQGDQVHDDIWTELSVMRKRIELLRTESIEVALKKFGVDRIGSDVTNIVEDVMNNVNLHTVRIDAPALRIESLQIQVEARDASVFACGFGTISADVKIDEKAGPPVGWASAAQRVGFASSSAWEPGSSSRKAVVGLDIDKISFDANMFASSGVGGYGYCFGSAVNRDDELDVDSCADDHIESVNDESIDDEIQA